MFGSCYQPGTYRRQRADPPDRHRSRDLRPMILRFRLNGVTDNELSQAVVAYIRGAGLAWPHRRLEAVEDAVGANAAQRLQQRLQALADESAYWPLDWDSHDLLSAMELVRHGLTKAHPELSDNAVDALVWDFSYTHR